MKKIRILLGAVLTFALVFAGCRHSSSDDESWDGEGAKKGNTLSFNTGSFNALAIAGEDGGASYSMRSRSAVTDGMLMKILADGSVENFINVPSGVDLSPINYIAHSPSANAKEIYIVFNQNTWYNTEVDGEWKSGQIGQLLCVLEDGTYYDILAPEDDSSDYKWLYDSSSNSVAFDEVGGMYYLVNEGNGNNNTNMIYKFDPSNGVSKQLTAPITNTYYEKMQVSKDGEWIFTKANRWGGSNTTSYLRAIPTSDPENFVNIFYTSSNDSWINDWHYDDDTQTLYYIQDGTLLGITLANGTFSKENRKIIFGNGNNGNSSWFSGDSFLKWDNTSAVSWSGALWAYDLKNGSSRYFYFRNPDSAESEVQPQEIADYLLGKTYECLVDDGKTSFKENYTDYEIRFDTFASVSGYELIATKTAGLADAAAIKAITDNNLEYLIYDMWGTIGDGKRYSRHRYFESYEHNFLADIVYNKKTGEKISTDWFEKSSTRAQDFASSGVDAWWLFTSSYTNGYTWQPGLLTDSKVDATKVLDLFASYCSSYYTAENIDFSLECFKDDSKYSALYTDAKNEDAVKFLDNSARLSCLWDYLNDVWDGYNAGGKFLLNTCFKKDTSDSAYTWRSNNSDSIWWGMVNSLTSSYQKSLYGFYNDSANGGLLEIINATGASSGNYVDSLRGMKVSAIVSSDNGFYFRNAVLDAGGEETGNHHIQYYDVAKDTLTDLFANVADKDTIW